MSDQKSPYWTERAIAYLDTNFDKYKTIFEIILLLATLIIPYTLASFLSLSQQRREAGEMIPNPLFTPTGLVSTILFYAIAFCAWMLIRNNAKQARDTKKREERMVLLLTAIAKKMGVSDEDLADGRAQVQKIQQPSSGEQSKGEV
jgi:hypothetical protein